MKALSHLGLDVPLAARRYDARDESQDAVTAREGP